MTNGLRVEKLGVIEKDQESFTSMKRAGKKPYVLWRGDDLAAVFLMSGESSTVTRRYEMRLSRVYLAEDLKAQGCGQRDDFPVKISGWLPTGKDFEDPTIDPNTVINADINADGTDELVFADQMGGFSVYGPKTRLMQKTPLDIDHKANRYAIGMPVRVHLEHRDVVFYAVRRTSKDNQAAASKKEVRTETYIVKVDNQGINQVVLQGHEKPLSGFIALGALSYSHADRLDEMLVLYEDRTEEYRSWNERGPEDWMWLSRHGPDGVLMEKPKKLRYVKTDDTLRFHFVPGSKQTILSSYRYNKVHMITPGQTVGWIREVRLPAVEKMEYRGTRKKHGKLLVVAADKQDIYVLDEEGRCYNRESERPLPEGEVQPYMPLPLESELHELIAMIPSEVNEDEYLLVQSRKPQHKKLTEQEIREAVDKFLTPGNLQLLEISGEMEFYMASKFQIEKRKQSKNIQAEIKNLDDIKRYLPDYYDELKNEAREDYLRSAVTKLFFPIEEGDAHITGENYKNIDEYRDWLEKQRIRGQLQLSVLRSLTTRHKATIEQIHHIDTYQFGQSSMHYRSSKDLMNAVLVLCQDDEAHVATNRMYWIRHEGR